MLEVVKSTIDRANSYDVPFERFYMSYVLDVQDMDVSNEILPFVKEQTTSYISDIKKVERARRKLHAKRAEMW